MMLLKKILSFCLFYQRDLYRKRGFSLLNTIYYNFKLLPFKKAVKLPLLIGKDVEIRCLGGVILPNKRFSVEIGTFYVPAVASSHHRTSVFIESGVLIFKGSARIGKGNKIQIYNKGKVEIGDGFEITGNSSIFIGDSLEIGENCLFSWDILLMDYDGHIIKNDNGKIENQARPIVIGDHVWIGCQNKIVGGAVIPDGCIIGMDSFINKKLYTPNAIYIKNGVILKKNFSWDRKCLPHNANDSFS